MLWYEYHILAGYRTYCKTVRWDERNVKNGFIFVILVRYLDTFSQVNYADAKLTSLNGILTALVRW